MPGFVCGRSWVSCLHVYYHLPIDKWRIGLRQYLFQVRILSILLQCFSCAKCKALPDSYSSCVDFTAENIRVIGVISGAAHSFVIHSYYCHAHFKYMKKLLLLDLRRVRRFLTQYCSLTCKCLCEALALATANSCFIGWHHKKLTAYKM